MRAPLILFIEIFKRIVLRSVARIAVSVRIVAQAPERVVPASAVTVIVGIAVIGVLIVVLIIRIIVILLTVLLILLILPCLFRTDKVFIVNSLVVTNDKEQYSHYGEDYACDCENEVSAASVRLEEANKNYYFQNEEGYIEQADKVGVQIIVYPRRPLQTVWNVVAYYVSYVVASEIRFNLYYEIIAVF